MDPSRANVPTLPVIPIREGQEKVRVSISQKSKTRPNSREDRLPHAATGDGTVSEPDGMMRDAVHFMRPLKKTKQSPVMPQQSVRPLVVPMNLPKYSILNRKRPKSVNTVSDAYLAGSLSSALLMAQNPLGRARTEMSIFRRAQEDPYLYSDSSGDEYDDEIPIDDATTIGGTGRASSAGNRSRSVASESAAMRGRTPPTYHPPRPKSSHAVHGPRYLPKAIRDARSARPAKPMPRTLEDRLNAATARSELHNMPLGESWASAAQADAESDIASRNSAVVMEEMEENCRILMSKERDPQILAGIGLKCVDEAQTACFNFIPLPVAEKFLQMNPSSFFYKSDGQAAVDVSPLVRPGSRRGAYELELGEEVFLPPPPSTIPQDYYVYADAQPNDPSVDDISMDSSTRIHGKRLLFPTRKPDSRQETIILGNLLSSLVSKLDGQKAATWHSLPKRVEWFREAIGVLDMFFREFSRQVFASSSERGLLLDHLRAKYREVLTGMVETLDSEVSLHFDARVRWARYRCNADFLRGCLFLAEQQLDDQERKSSRQILQIKRELFDLKQQRSREKTSWEEEKNFLVHERDASRRDHRREVAYLVDEHRREKFFIFWQWDTLKKIHANQRRRDELRVGEMGREMARAYEVAAHRESLRRKTFAKAENILRQVTDRESRVLSALQLAAADYVNATQRAAFFESNYKAMSLRYKHLRKYEKFIRFEEGVDAIPEIREGFDANMFNDRLLSDLRQKVWYQYLPSGRDNFNDGKLVPRPSKSPDVPLKDAQLASPNSDAKREKDPATIGSDEEPQNETDDELDAYRVSVLSLPNLSKPPSSPNTRLTESNKLSLPERLSLGHDLAYCPHCHLPSVALGRGPSLLTVRRRRPARRQRLPKKISIAVTAMARPRRSIPTPSLHDSSSVSSRASAQPITAAVMSPLSAGTVSSLHHVHPSQDAAGSAHSSSSPLASTVDAREEILLSGSGECLEGTSPRIAVPDIVMEVSDRVVEYDRHVIHVYNRRRQNLLEKLKRRASLLMGVRIDRQDPHERGEAILKEIKQQRARWEAKRKEREEREKQEKAEKRRKRIEELRAKGKPKMQRRITSQLSQLAPAEAMLPPEAQGNLGRTSSEGSKADALNAAIALPTEELSLNSPKLAEGDILEPREVQLVNLTEHIVKQRSRRLRLLRSRSTTQLLIPLTPCEESERAERIRQTIEDALWPFHFANAETQTDPLEVEAEPSVVKSEFSYWRSEPSGYESDEEPDCDVYHEVKGDPNSCTWNPEENLMKKTEEPKPSRTASKAVGAPSSAIAVNSDSDSDNGVIDIGRTKEKGKSKIDLDAPGVWRVHLRDINPTLAERVVQRSKSYNSLCPPEAFDATTFNKRKPFLDSLKRGEKVTVPARATSTGRLRRHGYFHPSPNDRAEAMSMVLEDLGRQNVSRSRVLLADTTKGLACTLDPDHPFAVVLGYQRLRWLLKRRYQVMSVESFYEVVGGFLAELADQYEIAPDGRWRRAGSWQEEERPFPPKTRSRIAGDLNRIEDMEKELKREGAQEEIAQPVMVSVSADSDCKDAAESGNGTGAISHDTAERKGEVDSESDPEDIIAPDPIPLIVSRPPEPETSNSDIFVGGYEGIRPSRPEMRYAFAFVKYISRFHRGNRRLLRRTLARCVAFMSQSYRSNTRACFMARLCAMFSPTLPDQAVDAFCVFLRLAADNHNVYKVPRAGVEEVVGDVFWQNLAIHSKTPHLYVPTVDSLFSKMVLISNLRLGSLSVQLAAERLNHLIVTILRELGDASDMQWALPVETYGCLLAEATIDILREREWALKNPLQPDINFEKYLQRRRPPGYIL